MNKIIVVIVVKKRIPGKLNFTGNFFILKDNTYLILKQPSINDYLKSCLISSLLARKPYNATITKHTTGIQNEIAILPKVVDK